MAWPRLMDAAGRYPSVDGDGVTGYYHERFGLPPKCVLPGNGSIDAIYLSLRALGLRRAVVISPTFHDYERALILAGVSLERIPLSATNGFAPFGLERLLQVLSQFEALVVCNPNNPTGTRHSAAHLLDLADSCPAKIILVDEAFVQFLENYQETSLLSESRIRPNLLVFHSLTKLYAVPGLRIGCVAGHPSTIAMLKRHAVPWAVNAVAEEVARLLASCHHYEMALRDIVATERAFIVDGLRHLDGIRLFDTPTNFFLARWMKTPDLDDLLRILLRQGLYVRDCRNFPGLEEGFFRFSIRLKHENEQLVSAIKGAAGA